MNQASNDTRQYSFLLQPHFISPVRHVKGFRVSNPYMKSFQFYFLEVNSFPLFVPLNFVDTTKVINLNFPPTELPTLPRTRESVRWHQIPFNSTDPPLLNTTMPQSSSRSSQPSTSLDRALRC